MPRGRKVVNIGPCSVDGCHTKSVSKGMCQKHYRRKFLYGDTSSVLKSGPKPKPKVECAAEGCKKVSSAGGFCMPHYRRNARYGNPLGGRTAQGEPLNWIRENATHEGEGCLIWPFSDLPGYHSVKVPGGYTKAHREMCRVAHGRPPKGAYALHSCHNRSCVNPNHLRWGTARENAQDAVDAGRNSKGSEHTSAKLNESQVREIRKRWNMGQSLSQIAADYPAQKGTIWLAATRKTWRHVG